jgi:hypothetical protein
MVYSVIFQYTRTTTPVRELNTDIKQYCLWYYQDLGNEIIVDRSFSNMTFSACAILL